MTIQGRITRRLNQSPLVTKLRNKKAIRGFESLFEVIEFSFIRLSDSYNSKWQEWSRIYEYELMLDRIKKLSSSQNIKVHNTCWGFHGVHVEFKEQLESLFSEVTNSDLMASEVPNTTVYDVTKPVPEKWDGAFDFVINVSTVEEIDYPHIMVIQNLLKMVKPGGYLVVTFDFPGIQLEMVEQLLGQQISRFEDELTGANSPIPNHDFANLRAGFFILRRKP